MIALVGAARANHTNLDSLRKRLELLAGFHTGAEKFALRIDPRSGESSWDFKRLVIQIGLKRIEGRDVDSLAELLMEHEVGHVMHTSRNIDLKGLPYPFDLLNILEDARIEPKRERDFHPLHAHFYRKIYLEREGEENPFANPFNIGILLRWQRWGVATKTEKPPELDDDQYAEFIEDWNRFLDLSIDARSTEHAGGHAQDLYEKWNFLFDKYKSDTPALGLIEGSGDAMAGKGPESPQEGVVDREEHSDDTILSANFFGDPWFEWDMPFIQEQARILRQLLTVPSRTEKVYTLTGRRFDARRMENPPLAPFKGVTENLSVIALKRLLCALDGSGSMQYGPFMAGCFLAYILSLVFPVDICITTNESKLPIYAPLKRIDALRGFAAWGGSENYRSLGSDPSRYSFTLFLTDACVEEEDKRYARGLNKIAKVGAGYVGNPSHRLEDVFLRNFYAENLSQNVGRMVALFIKRHFTRRLAS
ncbi:MAG: hypothetical protein M0Z71_12065 [Nitrospiraceae bacterium]|nr:hypothetical protein [Nitrospiraceae bacterium]